MLAKTFKYMDQATWFSINRSGQLAISMLSGPSVNLLTWIYRCPAKIFDRFISRFSFRCKALPDVFANLPLSPAKTILENVYHTCRFQLKGIRVHYLIWEDLCMTWMKTQGVRIPRKLKWAASIAISILFLAAALWKVTVDREPKSRAKKQLSLRFGHMPFGPTTALDNFFAEWQPQQVYLQQ